MEIFFLYQVKADQFYLDVRLSDSLCNVHWVESTKIPVDEDLKSPNRTSSQANATARVAWNFSFTLSFTKPDFKAEIASVM